jgi:hypothetical protein
MTRRAATLVALSVLGTVCGASGQSRLPPGYEADSAALRQLFDEARALARREGCPDAARCRAVAIGSKACGGPRAYVVYCPLTTEEPALQRKAEKATLADRAFNAKYRLASDCAFVMEPPLESDGGACRIAQRGPRLPGAPIR